VSVRDAGVTGVAVAPATFKGRSSDQRKQLTLRGAIPVRTRQPIGVSSKATVSQFKPGL
jgi:hypothetical protein